MGGRRQHPEADTACHPTALGGLAHGAAGTATVALGLLAAACIGRRSLLDELERRLDMRQRDGNALSVLYIDLDDFKPMHDRHGHAVGDELLRAFAARLHTEVRQGDLTARLGGDEFVVLMDGLAAPAAASVAHALAERLAQPYALGLARIFREAEVGSLVPRRVVIGI